MSPSTRAKSLTIVLLAAGIAVGIATSSRSEPGRAAGPPSLDELAVQVNGALGLQASRLEHVAVARGEHGAVSAQVLIDGAVATLELRPSTVRAAGYQVLKQLADGTLVEVQPGPERTMRGTVAEVPGTIVAGSVQDGGLYASILYPGGRLYWVEPLAGRFAGADQALHVVYNADDVLDSGGSCGAEARVDPAAIPWIPDDEPDTALGGGAGELCEAELACDADVEYFTDWGSVEAVEARINMVIDQMNIQYELEVGITHLITAIIVRTAEPDPYGTTDPSGLLGQFSAYWEANHPSIQRDVAHLFTGKNLAGSVIGIAYLPGVCNGDLAYGLVQSDFNGNFQCATDLSAHELGHNWGAPHCTCLGTTMHASIQCANTFAQTSINSIVAYRDSLQCLDCTGPLTFSFPDGTPDVINPNTGATIRVIVSAGTATPEPGTGSIFVRINGGSFVEQFMDQTSPNDYEATFPPLDCADIVEYFFSADTTDGEQDLSPPQAPGIYYSALAAVSLTPVFVDDFEADLGWQVSSIGSTAGQWERAHPISTSVCDRGNPGTDADGTGQCFLTENSLVTCDSDVDSEGTLLTSPLIDASGDNSIITYWRWYSNTGNGFGGNPYQDVLEVEVSDLAGVSWTPLETVGPTGADVNGGWVRKSFRVADYVTPSQFFKIRFIASDMEPGSIVEAAIDGVMLQTVDCGQAACPWDLDGDQSVSVTDLLDLLGQWGTDPGGPPDFDNNGDVGVTDLLALLGAWGGCP